MQFLKKSSWSFAAVVSRGLGALAINKVFAYYFGASGITLLAHFQNLIALFTLVPNDAINRNVIRAGSIPEKGSYLQDTISTAILFTTMIFTLIMVFVFIRNDYFIEPFVDLMTKGLFIAVLVFSIMAILANLLVQAIIISQSRIKAYSILVMLGTVVLLVFLLLGVSYRLLELAFIGYAVGSAVSLVFSLFYLSKGLHFRITLNEPSKEAVSDTLQFIGMSLSVLVFGKFVDFYIRDASIDWFGMQNTGLWQSLVKLSDSYVMVYIGTIGVVFFPGVSALINKKKEVIQYLKQTLTLILPILIVFFIVIYLLGKPVLSLLFTSDFEPAHQWMHYQVIGDFFMLVSFLFAYILMAYKKTWNYVILQFVSAVLYLGTIYIFKSSLGIEAILAGHVVRNVAFFFLLIILIRKI